MGRRGACHSAVCWQLWGPPLHGPALLSASCRPTSTSLCRKWPPHSIHLLPLVTGLDISPCAISRAQWASFHGLLILWTRKHVAMLVCVVRAVALGLFPGIGCSHSEMNHISRLAEVSQSYFEAHVPCAPKANLWRPPGIPEELYVPTRGRPALPPSCPDRLSKLLDTTLQNNHLEKIVGLIRLAFLKRLTCRY